MVVSLVTTLTVVAKTQAGELFQQTTKIMMDINNMNVNEMIQQSKERIRTNTVRFGTKMTNLKAKTNRTGSTSSEMSPYHEIYVTDDNEISDDNDNNNNNIHEILQRR